MLTAEMKKLIKDHRAGMVASTNDDGTPSVSPKATFVIVNDAKLAFGNIRSPGTLANVRKRPAIEVCFIDVVLRTAVRVTGKATVQRKTDADQDVKDAFEADWSDYLANMSSYVVIEVTGAEFILSPAYDRGATNGGVACRKHGKAECTVRAVGRSSGSPPTCA